MEAISSKVSESVLSSTTSSLIVETGKVNMSEAIPISGVRNPWTAALDAKSLDYDDVS